MITGINDLHGCNEGSDLQKTLLREIISQDTAATSKIAGLPIAELQELLTQPLYHSPRFRPSEKLSLIDIACGEGNVNFIQQIIAKITSDGGNYLNFFSGQSLCLAYSTDNEEFSRLLIDTDPWLWRLGQDYMYASSGTITEEIYKAAIDLGSLKLMENIAESAGSYFIESVINKQFSGGASVHLVAACRSGNMALFKYLTRAFSLTLTPSTDEHNVESDKYSEAFASACLSGNFDLVKYLLIEYPWISENITANQNNYLQCAAASGNLEVVKLLVNKFPEVKSLIACPKYSKYTHESVNAALIEACASGTAEIYP